MHNKTPTTTTKDGRKIEVTRRVFALVEHPENKNLLRSASGSMYRRVGDGSLRLIEQPKLSKKEKSKLKRSMKGNKP